MMEHSGHKGLPLVVITMGDPCGIGPEIIVSALQSADLAALCRPLVVGDRIALERALKVCSSELIIREVAGPAEAEKLQPGQIGLIALSSLRDVDLRYGRPTAESGDAVYRYICHAARLCLDGVADAMVTAPISKKAMNLAGHEYPGHTELLAELCGTGDFVMMLAGDLLRVSLVTIHEPLARVPDLITHDRVLKTIRVTSAGLQRLMGKEKPRLAVAALNPHCGEDGMFGEQDRLIIAPAVAVARSEGIDAVGPLSADTLFHAALDGRYDGIVAMYHDQGLIPLKMLHFDNGVNITLGLPIIRTSVDHGTAYDLAGSGTASAASLLAAVRMAAAMARSQDRGGGDSRSM